MSKIILASKKTGTTTAKDGNPAKPYVTVEFMEDSHTSELTAKRTFYNPAMIKRYEALNEGDLVPNADGKIVKAQVGSYTAYGKEQTMKRIYVPTGETVNQAILNSGNTLPTAVVAPVAELAIEGQPIN